MILCLETSTRHCSVALANADGLINSIGSRTPGYSHAERLHLLIKEILDTSGVASSDISVIGISKGPGSFTGLRIGVSAAKGLAYAWDIPLASCSSMEALADVMRRSHPGYDSYVPMLDARRMEVYCQEFDSNGKASTAIDARVIASDSFDHLKGRKVLFAGDGALKCADRLDHKPWTFQEQFPEALGMIRPIQQAIRDERFEDTAYFEPYYLKEFIAGKPKAAL